MNKYWQHFKTITKHKYYVGIECLKIGLYWQGLVHDLSKYSLTEFFTSAKYFQGDKTPIGVEKAEKGYSIVWLNHKGKNKHHWEYWTDFYNGIPKACPMPDKYILEMACDMVGASKEYNHNFNYDKPLKYYQEKINKNFIDENTQKKIRKLLTYYANTGKLKMV